MDLFDIIFWVILFNIVAVIWYGGFYRRLNYYKKHIDHLIEEKHNLWSRLEKLQIDVDILKGINNDRIYFYDDR